jgi:hypothetical protein
MVWEYTIWLSSLALFTNLISLSMDTPGVLVGMPASCNFNRDPPSGFSLSHEEVKLAQRWSQKLLHLQKIQLRYAYELYSGNFQYTDDSGDVLEGRDVVLSKVKSEEGLRWLNSCSSA